MDNWKYYTFFNILMSFTIRYAENFLNAGGFYFPKDSFSHSKNLQGHNICFKLFCITLQWQELFSIIEAIDSQMFL